MPRIIFMERFDDESDQLCRAVAGHIADHADQYREAGRWLDQTFADITRKPMTRASLMHPRILTQSNRDPRAMAEALTRDARFGAAVRAIRKANLMSKPAITWRMASRVLLLTWLATDPDAEKLPTKLCELQDWPWGPEDGGATFYRAGAHLWTQDGKPYQWPEWLALVRRAWNARPTAGGNEGDRTATLTDADRNRLVGNYIRAQRGAGVPIEKITRDGVAVATGVSKGMVSRTRAWKALSAEKRQARAAPAHLRQTAAPSTVDEAIERGDWDRVAEMQAKEAGERPRHR